jgi:predicted MFS family arabinose efflux permease
VGATWAALLGTALGVAVVQRSLFVVAGLVAAVGTAGASRFLPRPATHGVTRRDVRRILATLVLVARDRRDVTFFLAPNRLFWGTRSMRLRGWRLALANTGPQTRRYFAAAALFFAGFAVFWAPLPIYLIDAGLDSGTAFGLYLVNNVASAALFDRAGAIGDGALWTTQTRALTVRGLAFSGVAVAALLGVTGAIAAVTVAMLLVVVGATWAFVAVAGTTIVTNLVGPSTRGAILGSYVALAAFAGGVGSLLGGALAAWSYPLSFVVAAVLVVTGALLVRGGSSAPTAG